MKNIFSGGVIALLFMGNSLMASAEACSALYNHQYTTLQGEKINLCDYQDRPILVVNTASKCGFAPQFERLEGLYKKHKAQGLLVVGFPSNDFKQELSSNKEIGDFCKATYSVNFPMMPKSSVVGADANPFYKQLAEISGQVPKWNFNKYVVLPGGKEVYAFESTVLPDSADIVGKIKPFLK